MFKQPDKSPWGAIQHCDTLCPGVFLIAAERHGGTMVSREVEAFLSPAAMKCGFRQNGFVCFEEDGQEDVVLRELLDKKLWSIPARVRDKAAFEENINKNLQKYNPAYWYSREQSRAAVSHARPAPAKETAARAER